MVCALLEEADRIEFGDLSHLRTRTGKKNLIEKRPNPDAGVTRIRREGSTGHPVLSASGLAPLRALCCLVSGYAATTAGCRARGRGPRAERGEPGTDGSWRSEDASLAAAEITASWPRYAAALLDGGTAAGRNTERVFGHDVTVAAPGG
jgi:hypothetical protein